MVLSKIGNSFENIVNFNLQTLEDYVVLSVIVLLCVLFIVIIDKTQEN